MARVKIGEFKFGIRSEERFSRNAETDLVCRLLLEKKKATEAAANGILYTNFPMHGQGTPSREQINQLLSVVDSFSGPVFVHCRFGCDRTGTIVACYRIAHDHWSNDLALREAKRYGISRWEFLMKRFVRNFAPLTQPASVPDLRQARSN